MAYNYIANPDFFTTTEVPMSYQKPEKGDYGDGPVRLWGSVLSRLLANGVDYRKSTRFGLVILNIYPIRDPI